MHGLIPKYLEFLIETSLVQPCNPAVGGPAKSQLVHEVDALGGEIGKIADRYFEGIICLHLYIFATWFP